MLDVVPGGRTGSDDSWDEELSQPPRRVPAAPSGRQARPMMEGPRVVKLTNKLPARLRRPVRQELERQRRARRVRDAIVRFERRPLYSEVPSAYPRYAQRAAVAPLSGAEPHSATGSSGVEQHTGDVYRQSRPQVNLPAPPYAGAFVRRPPTPQLRRTGAVLQAQPQRRVPQNNKLRADKVDPALRRPLTQAVRPRVQPVRTAPSPQPAAVSSTRTPPRPRGIDSSAVLDRKERVVQPPRRRFALPLHFSIWPWGSREKSPEGDLASETHPASLRATELSPFAEGFQGAQGGVLDSPAANSRKKKLLRG